MIVVVAVIALYVGIWIGEKSTSYRHTRDAAFHRRSGWRYGYGQGWVDCRRGDYDPEAPDDGMVRPRTSGVPQ